MTSLTFSSSLTPSLRFTLCLSLCVCLFLGVCLSLPAFISPSVSLSTIFPPSSLPAFLSPSLVSYLPAFIYFSLLFYLLLCLPVFLPSSHSLLHSYPSHCSTLLFSSFTPLPSHYAANIASRRRIL